MKLTYLHQAGDGCGDVGHGDAGGGAARAPALVVVHAEAAPPDVRLVGRLSRSGGGRPVIAPFGDYAFYPSGMEVGGLSWYRVPTGRDRADPITVCRAILQVCDLIEDLGCSASTVVGERQGAVVAIGAGLLRPDLVAAVAAIDVPADHLAALPPGAWAQTSRPALLLVDTAAPVPSETATAPDGGPQSPRQILAANAVPSIALHLSAAPETERADLILEVLEVLEPERHQSLY